MTKKITLGVGFLMGLGISLTQFMTDSNTLASDGFLSNQEIRDYLNGTKIEPNRVFTRGNRSPAVISPENSVFSSKRVNQEDRPMNIEFMTGLRGQEVDLRFRDTPVKSQFGGTCTTFGMIGAMENKAAENQTVNLSERHFWSLYGRYDASLAFKTATKNKVTDESYWPQEQTRPNAGYQEAAHTKLTKAEALGDTSEAVKNAIKNLDQHHSIYIAIQVPQDMGSCKATISPDSPRSKGQHALAVVGYRLDETIKGGGYFIIKNSWGSDCGDKGYQYFPFFICGRKGMYCDFWAIQEVSTNLLN